MGGMSFDLTAGQWILFTFLAVPTILSSVLGFCVIALCITEIFRKP